MIHVLKKNILNQPQVELHLHNETELPVEDQVYHLVLLEPSTKKNPSTKDQQEIQHSETHRGNILNLRMWKDLPFIILKELKRNHESLTADLAEDKNEF